MELDKARIEQNILLEAQKRIIEKKTKKEKEIGKTAQFIWYCKGISDAKTAIDEMLMKYSKGT